ncbi:hypothetical protein GCM10023196_036890 [Actinoallomurus vinaceus]|uniref:Uncharacterized protein n=1 Tax=Actinoallomurus vinaceus TaxID=1080074 RepID=A0ABP8UDV0_9ACTN
MSRNVGADVTRRLKTIRVRVSAATEAASAAMGAVGKESTQTELSRLSHPPGTPTPSPPGRPPAMVSGDLHDSVTATTTVPLGPVRFVTVVGATTVYARIQQFGGWAGRNHATYLPARPYLEPGAGNAAVSGALSRAGCEAFIAVMW